MTYSEFVKTLASSGFVDCTILSEKQFTVLTCQNIDEYSFYCDLASGAFESFQDGLKYHSSKNTAESLEFELEENSGQLVAHSLTTPFKTYWIEEGAWIYLGTVQGGRAGANTSKPIAYDSLEEAKEAANLEESQKE